MSFKVRIKKQEDTLKVIFLDQPEIEPRNVSFEKGLLKFETSQSYEDQPLDVEWSLNLEGNQLSGSLYYAFVNAPEEGELEVDGARIK